MKFISRILVAVMLVTFVPQVCIGIWGERSGGDTAHEHVTPVKDPVGHLQLLCEASTEVEEEEGREGIRDIAQPIERFQISLFLREPSDFRHTLYAADSRVPRTSIFVRVHSFLI